MVHRSGRGQSALADTVVGKVLLSLSLIHSYFACIQEVTAIDILKSGEETLFVDVDDKAFSSLVENPDWFTFRCNQIEGSPAVEVVYWVSGEGRPVDRFVHGSLLRT